MLASSLTKLLTMQSLEFSSGRFWIGGTCWVPAVTYMLWPPVVMSQVVTVIRSGNAVAPGGPCCLPPAASTADFTASGLAPVSTQNALKAANRGGSCTCAWAPAVRIATVAIRTGPNLRIRLTLRFARPILNCDLSAPATKRFINSPAHSLDQIQNKTDATIRGRRRSLLTSRTALIDLITGEPIELLLLLLLLM